MAYGDSAFSFNPQSGFSFNPSSNSQTGIPSVSPDQVTPNPYVPSCGDTANQLKEIHRNFIESYANQFGQVVSYQPVKFNFNTYDFLYGEDPISGYHYSRKMKAVIDFTSYTTFLTKFGIMSDADITIYVPISEFSRVWGPPDGITAPLAGDLFMIDDQSCDRPLGQSPMVWEVTDKDDKIKPVDYMGGHYVWKLTAKRFDYSYQPNAPEEKYLDDETTDSKQFGRLPGGDNPPDMSGTGYDVDKWAKQEFDLPPDEQSVYGRYL
jgi:hypothetical protein